MENCNKSNKIVTISEFFQPFLLRISYITLCDLDFTYTIFTITSLRAVVTLGKY